MLRRFPPRTLGDLKAQRDVLLAYAATSPGLVLCGFCCCYVLLQTCAVPGTLSLSLLAGALYGWRAGLVLVAGERRPFLSSLLFFRAPAPRSLAPGRCLGSACSPATAPR